jgi:hypothetical protein
LAAQTHDAPDFIEAKAERLRFADEAHLVQRAVVRSLAMTRSRMMRARPALTLVVQFLEVWKVRFGQLARSRTAF